MNTTTYPDHWKIVSLGEVTEIVKGGTPSRKIEKYFQGENAWAIPSDITALNSAIFINDTASHITDEAIRKSSAKILPIGTVLLTSRATIGETAITTIPMSTNQGFSNFICNESLLNVFLAYYLRSIRRRLNDLASGSTFKEITKSTLLNVEIPLPPLPEQRAIAHILQTIQEAKFTRQREIELERERKAALMDHLFTHGTKGEPRKQTEIGEIPESWSVVRLGESTKIVKGGTPSRSEERFFQGDIAWAIPTDITSLGETVYINETTSHISHEGLNHSAAKLLPIGTVLLTSRATIGETAINTIPMATNQGFTNFICTNQLHNIFLAHYFQYKKNRLLQLGSGSTFKEITKRTLLNVQIPLPSVTEQKLISDIIEKIGIRIEAIKKEVVHIDELFHAMLEELMTGKRSAELLIEGEIDV
ncbi:restriction endonuclease subunit S [Candidatus Poribacteria bacterium]|nr:restriction endonuclease subunit S [Candidatus Poribacteria bacterium]